MAQRYAVHAMMKRHRKISGAATPRSTRGLQQSAPNRLRIIGGQWRGLRITFPPLPALRPSTDRVRETVFNWLQPIIVGTHCLDLFAGSGALGIEALSRGAAHVDFVDCEPRIADHLEQTLQRLGAVGGFAHVADAYSYLERSPRRYEVVFLDPPYATDLLPAICNQLATGGWLAPGAMIYLECAADQPLPALPAGWQIHRSKRAGQVGYHLLKT